MSDNRSISEIIKDELKEKLSISISSMGEAYSTNTDIDVEICYDGEVISKSSVTITEGER